MSNLFYPVLPCQGDNMEGVSTVFLVVIILAAGGATGAYMAIEDFDLLDSGGQAGGQDGGVREVGPRYSEVDTEECAFHDGECGNTGQVDPAACGSGQGCC